MASNRSELFDEDSDQEDREADQAHLRVNEDYAKRFEYNKKRAELHRLQEKHPEVAARIQARGLGGDDGEDESSTSEEEDEGQLNPETDQEWVQALLKIRKKDPSIYDSSTNLFDDPSPASSSGDSDADENAKAAIKAKKSKKTLRDILYDQAVADTEGQAEEADTDIDRKRRLREERADALAYDPEQRALRDALVTRMQADDSDAEAGGSSQEDDLGGLTIRQRATADNATDRASAPPAAGTASLEQYFAVQDELPTGDARFLRDYFRQRLWEEPGDDAGASSAAAPDGDAAVPPVEEDEEFLDRADQFEHKYNFRSEEPRGAEIRTYPRQIEGLVRHEESRRRRQRESKRTRQEEREAQRADEVKRLKNLKKAEVGDALSKLASVSGKGAPGKKLLKQLMDNDFDPDAWDQHMADAFGDDYYAEAEPEMDVVADADAVLQQAEGWTGTVGAGEACQGEGGSGIDSDEDSRDDEAGDGGTRKGEGAAVGTFDAVHMKLTGKKAGLLPETDYGEPAGKAGSGEDGGGSEGDDESEKVEKLAESRDKIHSLLQEYYALDHEDEVGGVKTRFRYRRVEPIHDGLSAEEILALPDRDLNAIVGLRKLAPYHDDTHRIRPNYMALNEAREKLIAQGLIVPKGAAGAGPGKRGKRVGKERASGRGREGKPRFRLGDAGGGKAEVKGKEGVAKGRVEKKGGVQGGMADEGKKGKRPGPRLRKALKEAAAAATAGAASDAEDGCAGRPPEGGQEAGDASGKREGAGKKRRKALQDMDEEEKKEARLASYAPVTPGSGRSRGHGSGGGAGRQSLDSGGGKGGPGVKAEDEHGASGDGEFAGMSKAAKKNMKRKLKRQAAVKPEDKAA
eukprot:jgi/Ulvmu1/11422/UM075_0086.1